MLGRFLFARAVLVSRASHRRFCNEKHKVLKVGSRVRARLSLTEVESGTALFTDAGTDCEPIEFCLGSGEVLPGLDTGLVGCEVGSTVTFTLSPAEGFGLVDPARRLRVQRSAEAAQAEGLVPGAQVQLDSGVGRVVGINSAQGYVEIDTNHALAGKTCEVTVEIVDAEADDGSALRKEVVVPGDGDVIPTRGDRVSVHYVAMLAANGKEFDSSRRRGAPLAFQIGAGRVVQGLETGITRMTQGERARIFVPAELAYGTHGTDDGVVPPDAALVFEVDLLRVVPRIS